MEKAFRSIAKEANDIDTKWVKKYRTRQLDQKYWHAKTEEGESQHMNTSITLQQATFWIASEVKAE